MGRFLEKNTANDSLSAWSGYLSSFSAAVPNDVCEIGPVRPSFEVLVCSGNLGNFGIWQKIQNDVAYKAMFVKKKHICRETSSLAPADPQSEKSNNRRRKQALAQKNIRH